MQRCRKSANWAEKRERVPGIKPKVISAGSRVIGRGRSQYIQQYSYKVKVSP